MCPVRCALTGALLPGMSDYAEIYNMYCFQGITEVTGPISNIQVLCCSRAVLCYARAMLWSCDCAVTVVVL